MRLSENKAEIDQLLALIEEQIEDRQQVPRACRIVAPFAGHFPTGGGRVIRSPRILFEEMSDYLGDVD
jgi:hypothetical protein